MNQDGAQVTDNGILSDDEQQDDQYRLMAYGNIDNENMNRIQHENTEKSSEEGSFRQISHGLSREFERRRSSIRENLPETPQGWTVLLSSLMAAFTAYEIRLQTSLTARPEVFGQVLESYADSPLNEIYRKLIEHEKAILLRKLRPSLFIGTRSVVSSVASFLLGGPPATEHHLCFREIMRSPQDNATFAIDWELPPVSIDKSGTSLTEQERKNEILHGTIRLPIVLILHGLNNDASFGYVKSMMRKVSNRGWIAVGMNLRGCGGVEMTTPRGYNGAYTGDIRFLVLALCSRLGRNVPLLLVGNSMGANLVAKYLGEEGLSGTLPEAVIGGIAFGNPMGMNSGSLNKIWSPVLALGTKKTLVLNWMQLRKMKDPTFQETLRKALLAPTLEQFDDAMAPIFARNDTVYPFSFHPGFKSGKHYGNEASSYRLIRYVSVPLLQVIAADDFLVFAPFRHRLSYCVSNPNVLVVETKVGGHLGWQQAPKDGNFLGPTTSWADDVAEEFIEATIESYCRRVENGTYRRWPVGNSLFRDEEDAFRSRL